MAQRWTEHDIPDQHGRVAIVTGANSGIGWDTARALANRGATVIMACRNLPKGNLAAQEIAAADPASRVVVLQLDLGDLDSVRSFAAAFLTRFERLDLLINNAGVMMPPYSKTAQGFEQQLGVNHLGHFALTGMLLDRLTRTPGSRVVTVSSSAHRSGTVNFDDLQWERDYPPMRAYGQSKLANLLFTYELQRRLTAAGRGLLAVAAHPGWTSTNLQQHSGALRFLNPVFAQPQAMGALPTLYAAVAPEVRGGDYIGPGGPFEMRGYPRKVASNGASRDEAVAQRLWTLSEDLTGVRFGLAAAN